MLQTHFLWYRLMTAMNFMMAQLNLRMKVMILMLKIINPLHDYPDEETSKDDDEGGSKTSNDESDEHDSASAGSKSSEPEDQNWSEDADPFYEGYICGDGDEDGDGYYCDGDGGGDNDEWKWSYH